MKTFAILAMSGLASAHLDAVCPTCKYELFPFPPPTDGTTPMTVTSFDGTKKLGGKNDLDFVHLEGDKYMLKSGSECLIFSENGDDKYPSMHNWGANNEYCGFPPNSAMTSKERLLDNGKGVFSVILLEDDKYLIKSWSGASVGVGTPGGRMTIAHVSLHTEHKVHGPRVVHAMCAGGSMTGACTESYVMAHSCHYNAQTASCKCVCKKPTEQQTRNHHEIAEDTNANGADKEDLTNYKRSDPTRSDTAPWHRRGAGERTLYIKKERCAHEAVTLKLPFTTQRSSNGAPAGCIRYNDGRVIWIETCANHANCGTRSCNGCTVLL